MNRTLYNDTPRNVDGSPADNHEQYGLLMSLALDGELEPGEEVQLTSHLQGCESCNRLWQIWQSIDSRLQVAPMVVPADDFVLRFEARLESRERNRRLRLGIGLALLATVLWLGSLVGSGLLLGLLVYNQLDWIADALRGASYAWTLMAVFARSLWSVGAGLVENPSIVGFAAAYLLLTTLALGGWSRYLQRSTHVLEAKTT